MSGQTRFGATNVFRPEWTDTNDTIRWLNRMFIGETLVFPCGKFPGGDVRVDIDESVNPDVVADFENIPFKENSFDTVYCDPPYSYYAYDKVGKVVKLAYLARKRFIVQTTNISLSIKNWDKRIFLHDRPSRSMVFRIFQVFDEPNESLDSFTPGGGK